MEITGACHCGQVELSLAWPGEGPLSARACDCGFCAPRCAAWISDPGARLGIRWAPGGEPGRYRFATGTADFLVCGRCGAVPAAVSRIEGQDHAVVNVRHLDLPEGLELREGPSTLGGETLEERLARRRAKWIRQVVMGSGTYEAAPGRGDGLAIEAARREDLALVLEFVRELAEYERLAHEVVATPEGLEAALFGPDPVAEVLIARRAGEAAGFALYFHNYSTFLGRPGLYLEDLYVRPAHRGAGVGRALLERLAGIAVARGCGRMEWSVLDWNERAIAFYRGLGAMPVDGWTVFRLTGEPLRALAGASGAD